MLNDILTGVTDAPATLDLNLMSTSCPASTCMRSVIEKEPVELLENALEVVVVAISTPCKKTAIVMLVLDPTCKVYEA
jgi:hypothetical protein